jgi:hypothetical protein
MISYFIMKTNRLISEQSPYLLQHAHNPVNWFPWCDEAFEKAKKENKPVFLSIGYSTCHWCHVMEKESFEDEEVAQLMNDAFVSIKVDREERPDVDGIYMTVCQMLTGSGGWPLTIVMTPDKKPFFAGTYFPKHSRYGRSGMIELLPKLSEVWKTKQDEVLKSAEEITNSLIKSSSFSADKSISPDIFHQAFSDLSKIFDSSNGGFGKAPKFPAPHSLSFLLRYWKKSKNEHALLMVEKTLRNMRYGGIYDQIGYGFHRYSTDQNWLVPHFEKMLYDQALLAVAYIEAYQATKNDLYKKTAEEILEYVTRDMRSPEGGFYSAEDADSEGEEGKFYLWSADEIREALQNDANFIIKLFNIEEDGNWIDPMYGGKNGTNILHLNKDLEGIALEDNLVINAARVLFDIRKNRVRPYKDDKILTDWSSLMISAFAKAAQVFDNKTYAEIAESAVQFIQEKLVRFDGKLMHRFRNGNSDIDGNLDDYAFFIAALIDLYEATFNADYLVKAIEFQKRLDEYFWDVKHGGFFFTASDSERLLVRQKEIYDGAIPSGNSIELLNLVRLYAITANSDYENKITQSIKLFSQKIILSASAYTQFLSGIDFYFGPAKEIIITGDSNDIIEEYLSIIRRDFNPNKIILLKNELQSELLSKIAGYTESYSVKEGKCIIYICENYQCGLPIDSKSQLLSQLSET